MSIGLIIDLSLIGIILLFGLIGIFTGFFKSILSLFGFLGSIICAYLFREQIAQLLETLFGLETFLQTKVGEVINGLGTGLNETKATAEELYTVIQGSGMNTILQGVFIRIVSGHTFIEAVSVVGIIAPQLAHFANVSIGLVVLYALIRILVLILNLTIGKLAKGKVFGKLNKTLGFILGIVKGAAIVIVIMVLGSAVSLIPAVNDWLTPNIEQTTITKNIYEKVNTFVMEKISGINFGVPPPETP